MKTRKRIRVRQWDTERCLLTDTTPFELPVIVSNLGLHAWARQYAESRLPKQHKPVCLKLLGIAACVPNGEALAQDGRSISAEARLQPTSPYTYRVRDTDDRLRELALPHPAAQLCAVELYRHFDGALCTLSKQSKWSIRHIDRIANAFYRPRTSRAFDRYKREGVDTVQEATESEHAGSYFAYEQFDRPHKFFDSKDLECLERRFTRLRKIDVARCFPSIYTHTIEWAIGGKDYSKYALREHGLPSLPRLLDKLMQCANAGETNGVLVGPELSRIFAELILQRIDLDAKLVIDSDRRIINKYCVRRYVDDIYVFTSDETVEDAIVNAISDSLRTYNLSIKPEKTEQLFRPFFSAYDRVITGIRRAWTELEDSVFDSPEGGSEASPGKWKGRIKSNLRRTPAKRRFIREVKASCSAEKMGYDRASGYILSTIYRTVAKIVLRRSDKLAQRPARANDHHNALSLLCEIALHMYSLCPTASNSLTLSRSATLAFRFLSNISTQIGAGFADEFMTLAVPAMAVQSPSIGKRKNYSPIGGVNLLLTSREFGLHSCLPADSVLQAMGKANTETLGYFEIVSVLHYCRDEQRYKPLLEDTLKRILTYFEDANWRKDSESVHLFLDSISCPFISIEGRLAILKTAGLVKSTKDLSESVWRSYLKLPPPCWFVQWGEIDILRDLQRKALSPGY